MTIRGPKQQQSERSLTRLLNEMAAGQPGAEDAVIREVYNELKRAAQQHIRRERPNHTLQPSALVNEAYLQVAHQRGVQWASRLHFLAVASHVMRHILVDYARARRARKRGGPQNQITLVENLASSKPASVDVIALHDALERLSRLDERQSRLLELRYFGGLTFKEAAIALNTPLRTLERDWQMARAWLRSELSSKADDAG